MSSNFLKRVSCGKCGSCGIREHEPNLKMCLQCLKKNRKRQQELYKYRKSNNLCRDCGAPASNLRCDICLEKSRKTNARIRKNRLDNNLCYDCGKPVNKHKCRCDNCHNKQHIKLTTKRNERKSSGICIRCGKFPKIYDSLHCEICFFKITCINAKISAKKWKMLKDILDNQSSVCPYTNRKITIGIDASLDHKIPTSKGGDNSIENLQWIYYPINAMKLNHSEIEFFQLIKELYENNNHLFTNCIE